MLKVLIAAAAFVVSASVGVGILVVWAILILLTRSHHVHSGGAALMEGLNTITVFTIPTIFGIVGAFLAVRQYNRGPQQR